MATKHFSLNQINKILLTIENKTRETRVLSRPAICWIHYVQIALRISAILKNAQQCSTIFINALKHSDMLINAQQCSKCSRILKLNILAC